MQNNDQEKFQWIVFVTVFVAILLIFLLATATVNEKVEQQVQTWWSIQ